MNPPSTFVPVFAHQLQTLKTCQSLGLQEFAHADITLLSNPKALACNRWTLRLTNPPEVARSLFELFRVI
jgi:hypothetical protein